MPAEGAYYRASSTGPNPIRAAISCLCGGQEPPDYVRGYATPNDDMLHMELTVWVANNVDKSRWVFWSTAYGIIEAANALVAEAVSNNNIEPPEYWTPENLAEYERLKAKAEAKARPRAKARSKAEALEMTDEAKAASERVDALFGQLGLK